MRQNVLFEQAVNGGKRPNWELERHSENHYHRDARTSRRWPTGKNEETVGVLRTTLGGPNTPPFRLLASFIKAKLVK